jgi:hypothetical protein
MSEIPRSDRSVPRGSSEHSAVSLGSLKGAGVDGDDREPIPIAVDPFEVVLGGPKEVPLHRGTFGGRYASSVIA